MDTLEHKRIKQSLITFFKCFNKNGSCYIASLFKPRVTSYALRSRGLNVEQNSYNSRFFHGLYTYIISRIWNQLPLLVKNAPNVSSSRKHLNKLNFIGC